MQTKQFTKQQTIGETIDWSKTSFISGEWPGGCLDFDDSPNTQTVFETDFENAMQKYVYIWACTWMQMGAEYTDAYEYCRRGYL